MKSNFTIATTLVPDLRNQSKEVLETNTDRTVTMTLNISEADLLYSRGCE